MLCPNCQNPLNPLTQIYYQNNYFCQKCYNNLILNKTKSKYYLILGISIFLIILGISLLFYWYLKA